MNATTPEADEGPVERRRARLADEHGRFSVVAIDHRPPLFDLVRQAGRDDVEAAAAEVRAQVVDVLGPHASAVLVDPESLAGGAVTVDAGGGLIVTYEHHVVHERRGGRRQTTIPGWSVGDIDALGADAVKMLVWWHPDAWQAVRHAQDSLVVSAHHDCVRRGLPLVLEPLTYPLPTDPPTRPERSRAIQRHTIGHFAADRFGVDVFRIGCPSPADVPSAASDHLVDRHFAEIDQIVQRPWTLLSGGHDGEWFVEMLDAAVSNGASGHLAGRSPWWQAATAFPDLDRVRETLEDDAVPYMQRLDRIVAGRRSGTADARRARPGRKEWP